MIASLAQFLIRLQCYNLSGSFLTIASKFVGRGCNISYNREGYWRHRQADWVVNEAFPNIRIDVEELRRVNDEVYFHSYRPGTNDTCIDLGAGIGTECISMSKMVGPNGRVYAIEASPLVYKILNSNILENKLENVSSFNVAIADRNGKIRISDEPNEHISNSVWTNQGVEVDALTIDDFIDRLGAGTIDFLKVNIEGAEKLMISRFKNIEKVRHVAISCHDFLGRRTGDPQLFTRDLVTAFLKENDFRIQSRNTGVDYVDDWIYGVNPRFTTP